MLYSNRNRNQNQNQNQKFSILIVFLNNCLDQISFIYFKSFSFHAVTEKKAWIPGTPSQYEKTMYILKNQQTL